MPGAHFVEDALAAIAAAIALGVPLDVALAVLASAPPPPGGFELVRESPRVVVDHAHTPHVLKDWIAARYPVIKGSCSWRGCGPNSPTPGVTRKEDFVEEDGMPFARGGWLSPNVTDTFGPLCNLDRQPQDSQQDAHMAPHRLVRGARPQTTQCVSTESVLTVKPVTGCWFERFTRKGEMCAVYSDVVNIGDAWCPGRTRVLKTKTVNIDYSYCYVANPSPDTPTRVQQEATCWNSGSKIISGTFAPNPPGTTRLAELRP